MSLADLSDPAGACKLLAGVAFRVPRLQKIWADAAYRGKELAGWCKQHGGWELEIVEREPGSRGFQVQPRRWVVERSFAWLIRNRRLAKDDERTVQTSPTLIEVAATRLVLGRLAAPTGRAQSNAIYDLGRPRHRSGNLGDTDRMWESQHRWELPPQRCTSAD